MGETVVDYDEAGKLGSSFMSMDELKEIDIGDGSGKSLTYLNMNLM
jgi:hypothetical protein